MVPRQFSRILILLTILSLLASWSEPTSAQPPRVYVVEIRGTISSVTLETVNEALAVAVSTSSPLILALDTPGGLLDATFEIVKSIEGSGVPIIGFVSPAGSVAASAGTIILLSTHVAAMAPNTIIGSAQPLVISPTGGAEPAPQKTVDFVADYLVERARIHKRNETAARDFVKKNLNLDASQALAFGVVEYLAPNVRELLNAIDGTQVNTLSGNYTFQTANAEIVDYSPSIRILVLRSLADPVLASILFFIGFYLLIFGMTSPGHGSEIAGAILLIAGLIGLGILGANLAALLLIGLGAALLLAELFSPGFGAFGIGGFIAVVLGSLLLFSFGPLQISQDLAFTLFLVLLLAPVALGGFFLFAAYKIIEVRRRKPVGWTMIEESAEATEDLQLGVEGFVLYQGELWRASTDAFVKKGGKVRILAKEGPLLKVTPQASSGDAKALGEAEAGKDTEN